MHAKTSHTPYFLGLCCLLVFLLTSIPIGCTKEHSQEQHTDANVPQEGISEHGQVTKALEVYQKYCQLCHGEGGKGYQADGANALSNQSFLSIASDDFLRVGIEQGRPGTSMSAWGQDFGGPLSKKDVDLLISLIRSWQTKKSIKLPSEKIEGSKIRGEIRYEIYCAGCHGKKGEGDTFMSLNNPVFLDTVSDQFLFHSIAKGREDTPMPAYETKLSKQEIKDIVALIRSWQKPIDQTPIELPSKELKPLLQYPDGKEPPFPLEGKFISMKELKQALEQKQAFVLLDARPPSDYVKDHIPGALSVPFYAASEYLAQLPKQHWYVTYCGCPHAESGILADTLRKNGYKKVKVFNEGYREWKKAGHPTVSGKNPK